MGIKVTNDDSFKSDVIDSELPVLVDFYADWCAPCTMAAPVLAELSEEYAGKISVVKINIDDNSKSVSDYEVSSIPSVVLIYKGEVIDREVGFQGKAKYDALVQKGLSLVGN